MILKRFCFGCFLFLTITNVFSQKKIIFDIARNGSLIELKTAVKGNHDIINKVSNEGYTPLTLACYYGNLEVAKYLIKNVKDVNSKSGYGTPLMAATVKKNIELTKLLLENKANPNITDQNGSTALHFAVIFNYIDIVKLLVAAKAKTNLKDNRGKTALDYAQVTQNKTIIQILKPNKL
jgi:ankyrin repeat protein